jgi:predicted dehydrogenase
MAGASKNRVRIGIVGGGFMGARHAALVAAHDDTQLVGIADPSRSSAGQPHGVPVLPDQASLVAAVVPDALIIATPPSTHAALARAGLGLALPMLLEKPAATRLDDIIELDLLARAAGVPVLVGHHRQYHPAVVEAARVIRDGELGRIVGVTGTFALRKDDRYHAGRRPDDGGILLTNLVHDIDLMRVLVGDISRVAAFTSTEQRGLPGEDTVAVTLEFASGALGTLFGTDAAPSPWGWDQATTELPSIPFSPHGTAYRVLGTEAALSIPDLTRFAHDGDNDWHSTIIATHLHAETGDAYVRQLDHFVTVVRCDTDPLVTLQHAAETQRVLEAIEQSARSGEPRRVRDQATHEGGRQ